MKTYFKNRPYIANSDSYYGNRLDLVELINLPQYHKLRVGLIILDYFELEDEYFKPELHSSFYNDKNKVENQKNSLAKNIKEDNDDLIIYQKLRKHEYKEDCLTYSKYYLKRQFKGVELG